MGLTYNSIVNQEIIELYQQGLGPPTIAKRLGCSSSHVLNILKRNDIPTRGFNDTNIDEVIRLYADGYGLRRIAREYGCSPDTIKRKLIKKKIQIRKPIRYGKDLENEVIRLYELHSSCLTVAKTLGISPSRVYYVLGKCGRTIKKPPLVDIDEIIQLLDEGKTIKDICDIFGKKDWQVRHLLKTNNIKIKDIKAKIIEPKIVDTYRIEHNTVKVASILNCSPVKIANVLMSHGVEIKKNGKLIDLIDMDFDLLINKYKEGCSSAEVGQLLGLTRHQVVTILKHFNVPRRTDRWRFGTSKIIGMYNNGLSMIEVARRIGCSDITVARILRENDIDIRPYRGENTVFWKDDRTVDSTSLCDYFKYKNWIKSCHRKYDHRSAISEIDSQNQCHHMYGKRFILKSSSVRHSCLPDGLKRIGILNDDRFYDINNGLILTKEEHCKIERTGRDAHYYWRIWRHYPDFALSHFPFSTEQYGLFNDKGMMDPKGSSVIPIDSKFPEVKKILRYEHYIGTIPAHKIILIGHRNNVITGIAVFGRGGNKNLPQDCWELIRLCVPYYVVRPFTIDFLNMCTGYIGNNCVGIDKIIAYSDPNIGHDGAIYRMAGWCKEKRTSPSYCYFDPAISQLKHKSYCRRIKGVDKTEKQLAEERQLIKIELAPLRKYSCPTSECGSAN